MLNVNDSTYESSFCSQFEIDGPNISAANWLSSSKFYTAKKSEQKWKKFNKSNYKNGKSQYEK